MVLRRPNSKDTETHKLLIFAAPQFLKNFVGIDFRKWSFLKILWELIFPNRHFWGSNKESNFAKLANLAAKISSLKVFKITFCLISWAEFKLYRHWTLLNVCKKKLQKSYWRQNLENKLNMFFVPLSPIVLNWR